MIHRDDHDKFYLKISNAVLEDSSLSWKARGLLAYLLSRPDNWNVIVSHLVKQGTDGKASVMAGLKELEDAGYIRRTARPPVKGRYDGLDSEVFETPYKTPDGTVSEIPHSHRVRFSANGKSATNKDLPLTTTDLTRKKENSSISAILDYQDSDPCFERESFATALPMKRNRKRLDSPVLQD